ncbi:MAG: Na+ dependent nucleoside transporter N-terminal domain-containing protein, partial [Planctomycetota bacterium]
MIAARALLGIAFFIAVAWLLSPRKLRLQWRAVVGGLVLQVVLAWLILRTAGGHRFFDEAAEFITKLVSMAAPGARAVFGSLADP